MANSKLTRILSIDGGGIRGILPGQILIRLEEKLKLLDNNPDAKLADYFDLMAGTSTGGILTCIYLCPETHGSTRPRFSAKEAVDLYMTKGSKIFDLSVWQQIKSGGGLLDEKYSAEALENALKNYLNKLRLSELIKPCIITSYDIRHRHAHFFTQHDAKLKETHDFYVRDVARATSAAPTYFEVSNVAAKDRRFYTLIDGGVFANNPTLCAYSEAHTHEFDVNRKKPVASEMAILSIGTGNVDTPYPYKKAKDWGLVEWIKPVIDIMMSGVSETVDYHMRQIFSASEKPTQYLRIDPELGKASREMDNASFKNLKALEESGKMSAIKNDEKLTEFAKLLIANK
jgi:uncharacterized protein